MVVQISTTSKRIMKFSGQIASQGGDGRWGDFGTSLREHKHVPCWWPCKVNNIRWTWWSQHDLMERKHCDHTIACKARFLWYFICYFGIIRQKLPRWSCRGNFPMSCNLQCTWTSLKKKNHQITFSDFSFSVVRDLWQRIEAILLIFQNCSHRQATR